MMTEAKIKIGVQSLNRSIEWKNEQLDSAIEKLMKHLEYVRRMDAKNPMKYDGVAKITCYLPNLLEIASGLNAENEKLALVEQILKEGE